ncbi:receptor-interacting serine/threonine-protein kinase 3-like [Archocentrus centrarchus]|uniref:receptor-interacting serine/threonine-protein kinase 3-like n=1 Tax=Archocentrus centrarchus TaxID=63155 RepID=UPI0011E9D60F|nr:receptor-interacting serine/threonine-protein kinase 3-like [Archocentrus centrarchus]
MALQTESIGNESLENWKPIGSGGFGEVYKARHKIWKHDVAIKLLHHAAGDGELHKEANYMDKVSCDSVLRVHGMYKGCPPDGRTSTHLGIVMEFMERGSVESLLKALSGPPPWPLAFRLAHEVALGMNFLHCNNILHHDLKPSNVLLNGDLHAKLADFGLSRVSTSALSSSEERTEVKGGTYKYMPPEAFNASYQPVRTLDIYSYGILLWSIVCGKEPFPDATLALLELRIPKGDRPPCTEIDQTKAEGLKELVDLMNRCWDGKPSNRPKFKECLEVTEAVFSKHKNGIHDAVGQVKKILDNQHSSSSSGSTPEMSGQSESNDTVDARSAMEVTPPSNRRSNTSRQSDVIPKTPGQPANDTVDVPLQNSVSSSARNLTPADKAKFVDKNRAKLIQEVSEVLAIAEELEDMVHPEAYLSIEAKSTSQDKMRELYGRTLRSGGEKVKAAFFDALKNHHKELVERLVPKQL